ncbi:tetratricopeptide repeat protein [Flavobacteriaceae bacterium]|nr:tetratricopeptide repeat protein [Flavobacteriaceae bacterium]
MKIFFFILLIFSNTQNIDNLFEESNDLYTNGDYQNAVQGYLEIVKSGFESAELYFNIGNSFYKLNNIPESNYYYEKAKSISPNDDDILTNLSFAQNLRIDKIEMLPVTDIQNFKLSILDLLSEKGWSYVLVILIWIMCFTFIVYNLSNDPKFKRLFFSISFVLLILSSFTLFINFEKKKISEIKYAIIYDKEIEVWSEPNNISELKFLLHEGTKVKQIDVIEDWLNIQLENGTIGWIQSSSLRILD